jgi:UDP-3-O-[3-hydroxymyristoyl] glucosamine N-acyltransferase
MIFDNSTIEKILSTKVDKKFQFSNVGMIDTEEPQSLSYLNSKQYIDQLIANLNIAVVFTYKELTEDLPDNIIAITTATPDVDFAKVYNYVIKKRQVSFESRIAKTAIISEHAYIAKKNVIIGDNVIVGPKVTILEGVEIGTNIYIITYNDLTIMID